MNYKALSMIKFPLASVDRLWASSYHPSKGLRLRRGKVPRLTTKSTGRCDEPKQEDAISGGRTARPRDD